jgi:hypothetical protein
MWDITGKKKTYLKLLLGIVMNDYVFKAGKAVMKPQSKVPKLFACMFISWVAIRREFNKRSFASFP